MNKNVSRKSAVDKDVSRMHSVDKDVSRKCSVLLDAGMDKQRVLLRRRVAVAWVLAVVQLLLSWVVPSWTVQALIAAFVLFCLGRSFFVQACRQLVRGRAGLDVLVVLSMTVAYFFSLFWWAAPAFAREPGAGSLPSYLEINSPSYLEIISLPSFEIVSVMVAAFLTGRWMEACGQGRFSVTLTDRITNVYVPVVLMVAVLAFVGWSLCGQIGNGVLAAVSVVIMACPCALGVAVPAALWMGMAKFSRLRVRVNHAVGLQRLGEADVVVLDKTGTLTEGCSTVTGWLWSHSEESSCKDVLLAALMQLEHPLSEAVVRVLEEEEQIQPAQLEHVETLRGKGIKVWCRGQVYWVGNYKLLHDYGAKVNNVIAGMVVHYESGGNEMVYFGRELELLAVVAISDPIRFTSFDAVKELRDMGLEVCMLTGDGERTAHSVASRLGIDYFIADALPEEKAEFVSELQRKGKKVAVVGDGVNDRQVFALADVSIAMGMSPEVQKNPKEQQVQEDQEVQKDQQVQKGQELQEGQAMLVLQSPDLQLLPGAIRLSRQVAVLVRRNLFWALIYNLLGIPVAAGILYSWGGYLLVSAWVSGALVLSVISVIISLLIAGKE